MKKSVTTALVVSVLMSLTAAATPLKGKEELSDLLGREIKIERTAEAKAVEMDHINTQLSSIAREAQSSIATAGMRANLQTNEGALNLIQVAKSIISSNEVLNNSNKVGNDLDKNASELKSSIASSNEAYASGMGLVAGKVHDSASDSGKAVAKVILMGKEIARGQLTAEQTKSYDSLMRGMTQLLKTGEAKTSEEALLMTLERLGMDKNKKVQELLGCKA